MKCGVLPLHDDQQALLAVMHVLVQAEDRNDVRPCWHSPVELHLPSGFGAVVEDLEAKKRLSISRLKQYVLLSAASTMSHKSRKDVGMHW